MIDFTRKLLNLARALDDWRSAIFDIGQRRRERVARYAETIADTLKRAGEAYQRLEQGGDDRAVQRTVVREFGRLAGYIEGIVAALDGRVDGRRIAGLKRRLEGLALEGLIAESIARVDAARVDRIASAEGHFRALADGLRA